MPQKIVYIGGLGNTGNDVVVSDALKSQIKLSTSSSTNQNSNVVTTTNQPEQTPEKQKSSTLDKILSAVPALAHMAASFGRQPQQQVPQPRPQIQSRPSNTLLYAGLAFGAILLLKKKR